MFSGLRFSLICPASFAVFCRVKVQPLRLDPSLFIEIGLKEALHRLYIEHVIKPPFANFHAKLGVSKSNTPQLYTRSSFCPGIITRKAL